MLKQRRKSLTEQINDTGFGTAPFHERPYQASDPVRPDNIQTNAATDNKSVQLRAYQIYQEKGGSDLDNWLEAERMASNA